MSRITRKFMRLLVFFDLPTKSKENKRAYIVFRKFLLNDGYDMIQWSVYGRIANGYDDSEKHIKRLKNNLPPDGSVKCLKVTEKQFTNILLLVGKKSPQEKAIKLDQLLLF